MENNREVPQKTEELELPYNPAIPPLGMYPKKIKSLSQRYPMFTAALLTIAKTWKQPVSIDR